MNSEMQMSGTDTWKSWEGRVVGGKFPLRQYLGGSDHSAVFLTDRAGGALRGEQEKDPQKAAIKLVTANSDEADRQLARWRAAAQLSHPGLIRIYESGGFQMNGTPMLYVVMECAEEDLAQILPQRPLTADEVGDMLPPLLDALSYLHGKGFVHTRIKPSNIAAVGEQLKLSGDQVKSLAEPSSSGLSSIGTRRDVYDAPETSAGIVSADADIWSVGVTLVAALTQNVSLTEDRSPGNSDRSNSGLLNPGLSNPSLPESIPEPFRGIARECIQLDPKRRCSIADIKARLQPAARSVPVGPDAAPARPPLRITRGAVIAAGLVVALLIALAVFYSRGKDAPAQNSASENSPAENSPNQNSSAPNSTTQTQPAASPVPAASAPPSSARAVTAKKPAAPPHGGVLRQVVPDVPQSAKRTITGTIKVAVRVDIDSSGKVSSAKLISSGPSKYFANLALNAARGWEFSPQPSPSTWMLRFRFKRTSTQVSPEQAKH